MRISDWSSDVCSSDLLDSAVVVVDAGIAAAPRLVRDQPSDRDHRAEDDAQPHVLEDEAEQHAESHQQDRAEEPLDAAAGPAGAGFGHGSSLEPQIRVAGGRREAGDHGAGEIATIQSMPKRSVSIPNRPPPGGVSSGIVMVPPSPRERQYRSSVASSSPPSDTANHAGPAYRMDAGLSGALRVGPPGGSPPARRPA